MTTLARDTQQQAFGQRYDLEAYTNILKAGRAIEGFNNMDCFSNYYLGMFRGLRSIGLGIHRAWQ